MNKVTLESISHSLLYVPPFDGLGTHRIKYDHNIERIKPDKLKIILTATLKLFEVGGSSEFDIISGTSNYSIKLSGPLVLDDLFTIWKDTATYVVGKFNSFEKQKGWRITPIKYADKLELYPFLGSLIHWYYGNPTS